MAWFIPETLAFYGILYEFYLRIDLHPVAMTVIAALFIACICVLCRVPIDPRTGRSAQPG